MIKKSRNFLTVFAVCIIVICLGLCAFADNADIESNTVEITSLSEFLDFAEGCTLDTYSKNKTFILKTDISLAGTDFKPIQNFYGTFDGENHTIKGLEITTQASKQGLFRRVSSDGIIKNLTVSGNISADGTIVGGLVGENSGSIINCTLNCNVDATSTAGGIAGYNKATGIISNCTFSGSVTGEKLSGGVAGCNDGIIDKCINKGNVCTEPISVSGGITNLKDFNADSFDVSELISSEFNAVVNIGGITGSNTGTLSNCTNKGTVGYNYQGYNIGGISGKSSGFVDKCTNDGDVFGQQDVGGIVGQLVPYLDIEITTDLQNSISDQLISLNSVVDAVAGELDLYVENDLDKSYEMISYAGVISEEINKIIDSNDEYLDLTDETDPALEEIISDIINNAESEIVVDTPDYQRMMDAISSLYACCEEMNGLIGETADGAISGIKTIKNQLDCFVNTVSNSISAVRNRTTLYEDISVKDAYNKNTAAVSECVNTGTVSSDKNAGGIVGISSVELDFDVAEALSYSDDFLLSDAKGTYFAVIRQCENKSNVTVRDSSAGGIGGYIPIGAVVKCVSSSTITAVNGSNAGGICGKSGGTIQDCSARVKIIGGSNAGVIVGDGCNLTNCLAYASIEEGSSCLGSIAGNISGTIDGNKYVDNGLGAIDGESFSGKAEPISYDEMSKLQNVPASFLPIQVVFKANGENVACYDVEFGGSVTETPEVADNDEGQFWKWDDFQKDNIFTGFTVEGNYYSRIPTLATEGEEPEFLVEGVFDEGMVLTKDEFSTDFASINASEEDVLQCATLRVDGYDKEIKVHMKAQSGGTLYVADSDGKLLKTTYKTDGSYIVFDLDNGGSFVYVKGSSFNIFNYIWYIILIVVAIAVVLIAVIKKRSRKKIPDNSK